MHAELGSPMSKRMAGRDVTRIVRASGAAILALTALACGGGGDNKVASAGDGTSTTAVAVDAGTGSNGSTDAGASGGAGSQTASDGAKANTAGTSGGSTGGATPAPAENVADSTPGLPAAGQYRFHTTGSSKIGAGPAQPIDVDTATTIAHLGDGSIRQSSEDQEAVLQWKGGQVLLHTMDLTRPGFERHFEAKPPVQYAPAELKVGQTWSWKLTATNLPTTIKQDSRVDRLETITLSGATVKAIVVVTKLTISGDVSGTIDLTQWVDTANKLPARVHAKTNIVTYGFTSDTTSDLTGFTAS